MAYILIIKMLFTKVLFLTPCGEYIMSLQSSDMFFMMTVSQLKAIILLNEQTFHDIAKKCSWLYIRLPKIVREALFKLQKMYWLSKAYKFMKNNADLISLYDYDVNKLLFLSLSHSDS